MGARGPAPEPTALKILAGNPGKRKLPENEPQPQGTPICPAWLSPPTPPVDLLGAGPQR